MLYVCVRDVVFSVCIVTHEATQFSILHDIYIVRFPIGLDFLFITFTFLLHLLLSWTSSLTISSSAISASTLSNHVFLGLPTGLLPSTLYFIHLLGKLVWG